MSARLRASSSSITIHGRPAVGDHVVDLHHARVRQRGRRPGLAHRALAQGVLLVGGMVGGSSTSLTATLAAQQRVGGAPDGTHPPCPIGVRSE
jgi:hypothetical protein